MKKAPSGSTPHPNVISLRGITKRFPGVVANDDISIDFAAGQVHCLLGENGAGKSTLISILAGMQLPDAGTIEIDGEPAKFGSPRAAMDSGIGVVYQHSTLVPTLSVLENLMLGERGLIRNTRRAKKRLEDLFELLGTPVDPNTLARDLGLGQLQQVEIAKAMWAGSRVLILDEPTSMLTPQATESLALSIDRLKGEGLSVVFITHKLREAYQMGDCVTVLRAGRNVLHIPAERMAELSEREARDAILTAMFGSENASSTGLTDAASLAGAGRARRETPDVAKDSSLVALELDRVSTAGRSTDVAVSDVSLSVRRGEIFGIAGIDGHGQTSLAEAVAGQRATSVGRITLDGVDVTRLGVRKRQAKGLRYITDDRLHEGTVANLSVALNLVLKRIGQAPYWSWGRTNKAVINSAAEQTVKEYDIRTPSVETRAGTLSGGNIQKILLARELSEGARTVVINKPTYGLDLKSVRSVHDTLTSFIATGGSVLLLSNELDELVELAHRIAVISRGRIVGVVENSGPATAERIGQLMTGGDDEHD